MHFTTQALVALLGASLALAAPTQASDYKESCKKEFDKVWNSHDDKWWKKEKTFYFDTEYVVKATPDQVIANSGVPTPGEHGARGLFKYGINIAENVICYNITLSGVTGQYQSPAITATHIHEGVKGKPGPPRLAFPNPTSPDYRCNSVGCLKGPLFVNVTNSATGKDQADGFHVSQIVKDPKSFFTDSHTSMFIAGAVRGQLPGY
ncbi:hypothetical protein COCC4DRAFT_26469 [Bipolaris maydis ATCC 48331]|uniref:CHRD domain-containing protein n=2 Tax=Cochliobolus heterostrophus TaxID=5016 RepID=N4WN53_COCH4|nr:uncharacterized protein COCC4DRAFT_26469 [Bipolaris maydis ATCC 48331]KAH7555966.1 hypothetical protein BM1_06492 [Bipolaris maydis]ENI01859.1 hypothetical protein COCC4DRAFT_26469 [Bipolaris maydis ATCC 48331]KAJ5029251.1 hypothetical protein J3E73DRAFT_366638 [Bipolaris maydis]KAJ5062012.1 hypothetical protein J3E74DRAFT_427402 [Bipolaris maydis]KAJ6192653.1 hypothetical protein J3E72DRAFT_399177 [Bipolaris maydis]